MEVPASWDYWEGRKKSAQERRLGEHSVLGKAWNYGGL